MHVQVHNEQVAKVSVSENKDINWLRIEFKDRSKITWFADGPAEFADLGRAILDAVAQTHPVTDLLPEVDDPEELERVLQSLAGMDDEPR